MPNSSFFKRLQQASQAIFTSLCYKIKPNQMKLRIDFSKVEIKPSGYLEIMKKCTNLEVITELTEQIPPAGERNLLF